MLFRFAVIAKNCAIPGGPPGQFPANKRTRNRLAAPVTQTPSTAVPLGGIAPANPETVYVIEFIMTQIFVHIPGLSHLPIYLDMSGLPSRTFAYDNSRFLLF